MAGNNKTRLSFGKARGLTALLVIAFVLCGLVFNVAVGTPSVIGFDTIATICPLGALETMLGAKVFIPHPLVLLAVAVVAILVAGKAFCSWVCPVPWLQRFFRPKKKAEDAKPAGSTGVPSEDDGAYDLKLSELHGNCSHECGTCALSSVGGKRDGFQVDSRHAVLAGTLASAAIFGFPVFCLICPVGITFATVVGLWNLFHFNEPSWGLVIFPAILILEVTVLRKWCSKICPISALMSLVANGNKLLKPRVKQETCLRERGIDCHACVDVCPEQVDPHSKSIPECTKCGKCIDACPAQAISIKLLTL